MWQCSALLVSCVLVAVLGGSISDTPKKYVELTDSNSGTKTLYRRPVSKPEIRKNVPHEVKRIVPGRGVSVGGRGVRNTPYPIEAAQFQEEITPSLEVESSRLSVKVPPSRKYYNPALKKLPFPFELPTALPYPFQSTAFGEPFYPSASGLDLLPTTAAGLPPTAIASLPPTSIDLVDFTSPEYVAEGWRSYQHLPLTAPSVIPNFSTRPPWIPRGGKSDFKPERGSLQTGSAPGNQVNAGNTKRPTVTSGNISELIKQVEQLIMASNQNSTNSNNTTIPNFMRFFKHPSVG